MIYSLRGKLIHSEPGFAVIECGGVGYKCMAPLSTVGMLPQRGSEVFLYTHLSVRDDGIDLFGFLTMRELECFRLLTSVNGVGAKVALSILSDLTPDRLALAVASGDAKALTRSAGVGSKIAQRIVLELKDKLGGFAEALPALEQVSQVRSNANAGEAMEALTALGYSPSEAALALAGLDETAGVEEMIKAALRAMAGR